MFQRLTSILNRQFEKRTGTDHKNGNGKSDGEMGDAGTLHQVVISLAQCTGFDNAKSDIGRHECCVNEKNGAMQFRTAYS